MLFCNSHLKSKAPLLSLFSKTQEVMVLQPTAGFLYQKVQIWFKTRLYTQEILVVRNCPKASLSCVGCNFESFVAIQRYSLFWIVENNLWEEKKYARITESNREIYFKWKLGGFSIFKETFSLGITRIYNWRFHANPYLEYSSHCAIYFCYHILYFIKIYP